MRESPEATWLRVADVALLLGVSANTVRRWTDAGRIVAQRSPGGHRRYLATDVMAILPNAATDGSMAQPGDLTALKRNERELRRVLQTSLDLTSRLADTPHLVPEKAAQSLCALTDAPHCDIYLKEGNDFTLSVSVGNGRANSGRTAVTRTAVSRLPFENLSDDGFVCLNAADRSLSERERSALDQRGCRALAWAPLMSRGELIGVIELTDERARDLSVYSEIVSSLAGICAEALSIASAYRELEHRDKTLHDIVELSREVSQTHDLDRFVRRFARRLQTTLHADAVDVFRATGGVIRVLLSLDRNGAVENTRDRLLDTSRYPALAPTLLDHTPLVIEDLSDPRLTPEEVGQYREWGYASSLTMPLVASGDVVGLVELYEATPREWGREIQHLAGMCQMVAGLFDTEALLSEARERAHRRQVLVGLSADLSSASCSEDVATRAATRLRSFVACADCDIWWLEEGYLRCLASVDADGVDESVHGNRLKLDRHPSTRQALDDREILVVSRLDDPRVSDEERRDYASFGFRSTASVPLVSNDRVVGLIDIFDVRERDYGEAMELLTSAGQTVADALRNSELLTGLRRGNAALRELVELGDRLSEIGTPDELARVVAERLLAILDAEGCDIWRIDGDALHCLASIDSRGWDDDEVGTERHLPSYAATVAALAANEPTVVADLEKADLPEAEKQAYRRWGYRSLVSLPLVVDGRPIGLIDLFDTKVRDFAGHLDVILNVSRLLAGSFERALLVSRLENSNRNLRLLVDSGMEFGATLDVESVLQSFAQRLSDAAQADLCDVYRLDGDEAELLASIGEDWSEDPVGWRFPLRDYSLLKKAAEKREPVACHDVLNTPELTPTEIRDAEKWGYRSLLDIPLLSHGEVIGFASLMNREPRRFEREDTIVGLAQIAAQAIANAELYRQLDEQLRRTALLTDSALELAGSLDLRETLLATANRLCESASVAVCEIAVIESDERVSLMRATDGKVDPRGVGHRLPLADARVTREVLETKRPTVVGSLRDPRLAPAVLQAEEEAGTLCWLTVPLIAKDRVIGVADLIDNEAERDFSPVEIGTASAICHAAALAIENAALFEREQATSRETELLNEIARRTAASLDLEEVVEAAVDALRQLMDFEDHSLLLMDGGTIAQVISSRPQAQALAGLSVDDLGHEFRSRVERERVTVLKLPDDLPEPGRPAVAGLRSAAVIALTSDAGLLGTLNLVTAAEDAFELVDRHLLERVGVQISLAIKNAQLYEEIKRMHLGNLKALSSALNAKDYYTLGHAARVAAYTVMLGRELGWPADLLESLAEAAYLHDIGKIGISDRVLLKPGRLNQQEWDQMREHPVFSADIIRPLFPEPLVLAVRHHHEHYDGSGYPDGLVAEEIPLLARAMAVVDAYDAMSIRRPYKEALTYPESLAELLRCRGTQFDPEMVDAFLPVLEDLARRRTKASEIAAAAAARIRGDAHARLTSRDDENDLAYLEIAGILREIRDANPPTRFLTTHLQIDKHYVMGVDPEEGEAERSHVGDEIFADDELARVLAGEPSQVNTVFADAFGVWITGLAPIRTADGTIVAAVEADLPALSAAESESLRGDVRQTFATMLQSAAARLSRAEIDAITDALTGLYNHRYLHERLSEELHRARENESPLSVLFCDLDHFKGYNDANGHSAGDQVLREVAQLIDEAVRAIDIAGRYGGEEFVVLLVETDADAALAVAVRIRERIAEAGFTADGTPLTVSIGVASYPADAERREELLDKADWAMYLAKRRGRDQVAAFSDG